MSKENQQRAADKANVPPKPKTIRKIGEQKFTNVESSFESQFTHCQSLSESIAQLEKIIKDKEVTTVTKDNKTVITKLSQAQLIGVKKKLNDKRVELKYAKMGLKMKAYRYTKVSRRNIMAAKQKIKSFNERTKLAHEANRKSDEISKEVTQVVARINNRSKAELHNLALNNGRYFNTNLYRILRLELRDTHILKMLNASSPVRTIIFRNVRASFGWNPTK